MNKIDSIVLVILIPFGLVLGEVLGVANLVASVFIPLVAIIFLINDILEKRVPNFKPYTIMIVFFVWTTVVSVFASDMVLAYQTQKRMMLVLMYCYILVSFATKSFANVNLLLFGHVISLIVMHLVFASGGADINIYDNVRDDIGFNANTYGYLIYAGTFSWILLNINVVIKDNIKYMISGVLIICNTYVLMISASRGGTIVYAIILIFWFISNRLKLNNLKLSFAYALILIAIMFAGFNLIEIDMTSLHIYQRFYNMEGEESLRELHMMEALRVGYNNIYFGVGGGNYAVQPRYFEQGSFSHNGYAEAFANYGLVGLLLYVSLMAEYIHRINIFYKATKKYTIVSIQVGFIIGFLVYNMFYVPYVTLEFMGVYFSFRASLEYEMRLI